MAHDLKLDLRLALAPRVSGGLPKADLMARASDAEAAVKAVVAEGTDGGLGFWRLPDGTALAAECQKLADEVRKDFDTLVVLGIGGSSLGGRTVMGALAPDGDRKGGKVIFLDNVDPDGFTRTLDGLDLEKTAFNVISKSGGTVETAAQLCLVRDRLKERFGDDGYKARMVATTDPEKGLMRELADADGLRTLPIPGDVGGRFSVLTAVGLFPSAFAGVDVLAMLAGAAAMRVRCARTDLLENPALANAVLHVEAMKRGRPIHVMMPYCDRLRPFAEWYGQLWAESLGKATSRTGETINVGPTPVAALGSTDQHSQVQLYVEGPHDKLITFLSVKERTAPDAADALPFSDGVPEGYAYLKGHSMGELLDAERRGTALALARAGRPSLTLELDRLDAHALGQLFFFYEAQTAFAGELLGIDAFDQPGVEMGKLIAFALMGRDGYADALDGMASFSADAADEVWSD